MEQLSNREIHWNVFDDEDQIELIKKESFEHPVLIYKHSTRCSISAMAMDRLERKWIEIHIIPYYLDVIYYRSLSRQVAKVFSVEHESPQALLIKDGNVIYHSSHNAIEFDELKDIVVNPD